MPMTKRKHRAPYPAEFRKRLVEMVRAGRTPESLAKDFEPTAQAIRGWVKQADLDEGKRGDGLTTEERQELSRLRRENKTLREEREILKKFAAWSVQEANRTPGKRSDS
jgi:transposase